MYEAVDTSINRRIALKELLVAPNLTGTQRRERIERFYREARAAGTLAHPNIVTIYEAGEDHGRHFIAMEFLEGQTLREVIDIEGKLSLEKSLDIAKQICEGLTYAHSRGVIHRDIKPDNIQVLPSGLIKITDFGIARIMEEPTLTADGQVFGTPSYMSPEQVAGRPLDQRTDIFSLGIVLYEMLTGRKPFTGDTVVTITYNIMNQDVSFPPFLPQYLERVVRRSLSKDPNLRYSSTGEMAEDLKPGNYDPYQMRPQQAPDPFGATISSPGPLYNPQGQYPQPGQTPAQPSQLPPDPFANLRPGDLQLPKVPSQPLLSPDAKYFLKIMFGVIALCAFLVGFILLLNAGYQGYLHQAGMAQAQVHIDAGQRNFSQQSYQAAIEEFKQALSMANSPDTRAKIQRNIAVSYISLGVGSENSGKLTDAAVYYQQATVYDPQYPDAYLFWGNALFKLGRDDDALTVWNKAVEYGGAGGVGAQARQNIAVLYNKRGNDAFTQNNTDAAIGWWRKAVDMAPGTQAGNAAQQNLDKAGG